FFSSPFLSLRSHWPIHGPHALVKMVAPSFSKTSKSPSLSAVYRICSEPGFIPKSLFGFNFLSTACCAMEAALDKSSYEEFVQEPISPQSTFMGQSFLLAFSPNSPTGVAKSGVKGPF